MKQIASLSGSDGCCGPQKPHAVGKIASLKLASVIENTDPLPSRPTALGDFAERFLAWVDTARLEEMTRKFYRNGWRLLKATPVVEVKVSQITGDCAEQLKFPGSAANANCALRTLRRMLHKAEEWKMIGHAPKIKMIKEHGRHLRLDDEAERKLLEGAQACTWRRRTFELFRDIIILMRDTGMRNQLPSTLSVGRCGRRSRREQQEVSHQAQQIGFAEKCT
jgi:hypothetical protein